MASGQAAKSPKKSVPPTTRKTPPSKATRDLPKVCPSCGTANPINAIVCSKCAAPI